MNESDLVYLDDYGLKGTNFYWHKHDAKGITKDEILSVGLTSDRAQVHKDIIEPLVAAEKELRESHGMSIFIVDAYRSKALYELVFKKRCEKFGEEETKRLFNMESMPHASGKSIDVILWDTEKEEKIPMRNNDDGTDALFVNFYKNKTDEASRHFQNLQDLLITTMQKNGFRLGTKNEYFHFDYAPDVPVNYTV